jgi:hypothetical protein
MNDNMFERATRFKIRFSTPRGDLSVEQLWDVPLRSRDKFNLDEIAKECNRSVKAVTEESFVAPARTPAHDKAELALEIVKHVIGVKLAEEEASKRRAANRGEKERLLEILEQKRAGKLAELSEEDLKKRIESLDA